MRSYDIEALAAGKAHGIAREETAAASPDLAAQAARAGRTEALAPAAVLRLQRSAGNAGVVAALEEQESPVKDVVGKGSGQPLEGPVRQRMEASFGADFSDVRVHSGGSAAASAQAVGAHAYTVGNEIVLGEGQGSASASHERTLAHELTHVVQQRSGSVDGTPQAGGISVSDPSDRYERAAESSADAVMATGRAPDAGAAGPGASVQRQEEPEEEEVQTLAVQRTREDEEERKLQEKEDAAVYGPPMQGDPAYGEPQRPGPAQEAQQSPSQSAPAAYPQEAGQQAPREETQGPRPESTGEEGWQDEPAYGGGGVVHEAEEERLLL